MAPMLGRNAKADNATRASGAPAQDVPALRSWRPRKALRVGVVSNPLSGGNRRGLGAIRRIVGTDPQRIHLEADSPERVQHALEVFAGQGVDLIVVNGGDGTIQAVLTGLMRQRPFPSQPPLALLCGGTSNMIPKDLGLKGERLKSLQRLLNWAASPGAPAALVQRPVLKVAHAAGQPPRYGMFFGAACIYKGIEFFHSKVHTVGLKGELAHGVIVARFLAALLTKQTGLVTPEKMRVELDDAPGFAGSFLLLLISSLEKLILGLRPFWGKGPGPLHMTAVAARPRNLFKALPAFARGTPGRHVQVRDGYYSHEIDAARLWFQGGYTLDGELYRNDPARGPLTVSTGGFASFLRLPQ